MNCPRCGVHLADGMKFCPDCGIAVSEAFEYSQTNLNQPENSGSEHMTASTVAAPIKVGARVADRGKFTVGIIIVIVGLIGMISAAIHAGTSFGADFYTYIYRILASIEALLGCLVAAVGASMIFKSYRH